MGKPTLWRSCLHKAAMTEDEAERHGAQEAGLMKYRCRFGEHWHVGHKKGGRAK